MSTAFRKGYFWLFILLGVVLAISIQHLELLLNPQALFEALCSLGIWTVPVFLIAHILATMVGVPGTLLVIVGGAKFGLWWGSLWSLIGATGGAIAAFWVARYLLQNWFRDRFSKHRVYRNIDKVMDTHSFNCVLAVRFAPLSPFNLVNFLFGLTSVSVSAYALGTLVGIAPGTVAYTWIGLAGLEAIRGEGLWPLTLALGFLGLLSIVPIYLRNRSVNS
ncbi:TVP38/TMEM64 family protein [Oscillatoria sp. CS-180]|uniref:TVP38/TMEM64 family protein n=1 Tax=Oscillatoria sp. CS-180 TaxID=3021720 RepID=UPI00232B2303|nr:TVP38/TMEM64 family protein [Oscillatoria sp. CS-180]MDB9527015.1 TVP38/TMEM64 family protein [Oscillatoria sp. CS-180]